jgi:hypothetical protein
MEEVWIHNINQVAATDATFPHEYVMLYLLIWTIIILLYIFTSHFNLFFQPKNTSILAFRFQQWRGDKITLISFPGDCANLVTSFNGGWPGSSEISHLRLHCPSPSSHLSVSLWNSRNGFVLSPSAAWKNITKGKVRESYLASCIECLQCAYPRVIGLLHHKIP